MAKEVKEYLTKDKQQELEKELKFLQTVKRKEIADAIEWAKSLGDLSENAEYTQAREDQGRNEARISEVENILQNAIISDEHNEHGDHIRVGSKVRVKNLETNIEQVYTIVGSEEIDVMDGKISNESPLGMALLGREANEKVIFRAPKGDVSYKILEVK